jgi:putative colanic acid biosynthesis UDP-glucose lipid carrier transferase
MSKSEAALTSAAELTKRPAQAPISRDNLLGTFESLLGPIALVFSLWAIALYEFDGQMPPPVLILSVLVFALTFPGQSHLQSSLGRVVLDILLNWLWVAGLMLAMGFATGYIREFSQDMLMQWVLAAPAAEFGAHLLLRTVAPLVLKLQGPNQRAIIVGMNEQGAALASRIRETPYSRIDVVGFVDSRAVSRLGPLGENRLLGKLDDLATVAKEQHVQLIYLSLPMASQPRILQLLDDLKDTTASIYFVPDMFFTDLIQGHTGSVVGMPVISVCETPFRGANGLAKRASDIVLALLILLLIAPLLLVMAIAVKLTSPGPVIFKQRRYGLDGEEILVYKFRSMTVTEDGPTIKQAEKGDSRITPLGAFMRRTSIDELPQFVNVLQGRMSIVGPRPHAIAHNELYRKLIKGYMVRHKVRPGITGWAQVNGYRGETNTLDKMQGRIDYDLDYLRNWSLRLDLHIILKTIRLVLKDEKAH